MHPLVGQAERAFLRRAARERKRAVVRDVPLLFETGGEKRCEWTVVVSAPAHIQAARVLARPGVTRKLLESVRAKADARCGESASEPISWFRREPAGGSPATG